MTSFLMCPVLHSHSLRAIFRSRAAALPFLESIAPQKGNLSFGASGAPQHAG